MDELVERCWEKLASLRGCDPMGALIIDRDDLAAIIPIVQADQRERDAGWIVGNAGGYQWRTWDAFGPCWTPDREKATRYARREDAELVHAEDEGAWRLEPFATAAAKEPTDAG